MPEKARLRAGDVLITRANTRELVGSTCRVADTPLDYFLSDKTLRLIPGPDLRPDFLVEVLQIRSVRRQIEDAATGTSASMKNISQASIRGLRVPVLDRSAQADVVDAVASLARVVDKCRTLSARASAVQGSVVSMLLLGMHEIPDSYDALLAETAPA
jgi:type I restriction enzyme S subunit